MKSKRIGIIVEGQAEQKALSLIVRKIQLAHTHILKPVFANIDPKTNPNLIAYKAKKSFELLRLKNVDLILLLIDLEDLIEEIGEKEE